MDTFQPESGKPTFTALDNDKSVREGRRARTRPAGVRRSAIFGIITAYLFLRAGHDAVPALLAVAGRRHVRARSADNVAARAEKEQARYEHDRGADDKQQMHGGPPLSFTCLIVLSVIAFPRLLRLSREGTTSVLSNVVYFNKCQLDCTAFSALVLGRPPARR
jgi:hypothetical protein